MSDPIVNIDEQTFRFYIARDGIESALDSVKLRRKIYVQSARNLRKKSRNHPYANLYREAFRSSTKILKREVSAPLV